MTQLASTETPIDLMLSRSRDGGYVPGSDPEHTLAWAFNGGGLAVATEVGMAQAMVKHDLQSTVDIVCGESAGAGVAAGVVADQLDETEEIFTNDLPSKRFIDIAGPLFGRQIINLCYLKELLNEKLDAQKLMSSSAVFGLGYTDMENFQPKTVTNRTEGVNEADMLDYLVWGMHMPWVAGAAPLNRHDERVADIGLSSIRTPDIATAMGATEIINFANKPFRERSEAGREAKPNRIVAALVGVWMERNGKKGCGLDYYRFTHQQARLLSGSEDANVYTIAPSKRDILPTTFTMNPARLKMGVKAGNMAVEAAIGFERKGVEVKPEAKERLVRYLGLSAATRTAVI